MILLRSRSALGFVATVLLLLCSANARGQLTATLDLTQTPLPAAKPASKTAPGKQGIPCQPSGILAMMDPSQDPKTLAVSIVSVKPKTPQDKENFIATLRLKNEAKDTIFIPWLREPVTPVPVKTTPPAEAGTEEYGYQTANLGLQFRVGNSQMFLKEEGNFWANSKEYEGHQAIWHGEWVDILLPFSLHCETGRSGTVCTRYLEGGPIQLVATWYEQSITDEYKEGACTEGSFTTRSITSEPMDIYPAGAARPAGRTDGKASSTGKTS